MCSFSSSELGITWEHPGARREHSWVSLCYSTGTGGATSPYLSAALSACSTYLIFFFSLLYRWFCGDTVHRAALSYLCLFPVYFPPWVGVPTCLSSALQPCVTFRSGRAHPRD